MSVRSQCRLSHWWTVSGQFSLLRVFFFHYCHGFKSVTVSRVYVKVCTLPLGYPSISSNSNQSLIVCSQTFTHPLKCLDTWHNPLRPFFMIWMSLNQWRAWIKIVGNSGGHCTSCNHLWWPGKGRGRRQLGCRWRRRWLSRYWRHRHRQAAGRHLWVLDVPRGRKFTHISSGLKRLPIATCKSIAATDFLFQML